MLKVKICGLTNLDDAVNAVKYGADFIGFVFVKGTPRAVEIEKAGKIISGIPEELKEKAVSVGLFADADTDEIVNAVSRCDLGFIQLHGSEDRDYCVRLKETLREVRGDGGCKLMKAVKVLDKIEASDIEGYDTVDLFLFDTFVPGVKGGSGKCFNWEILKEAEHTINKSYLIAGGLTPSNVSEAVRRVRPYGVDVSSGVEKEAGIKDKAMVKEFINNAKKA